MMEVVRGWIMSVVAVGLLVSLCLGISPGGKVQKVGRLCGGLLLFLAVVTPLADLDLNGSLQEFRDYCQQLSQTSDTAVQASSGVTRDLVAAQSEACIQAQARNLEADVVVAVTCETREGLPIPAQVAITGDMTNRQRRELTQWVMDAFDLTREQVRTAGKEVEGSK